ncbi:MAG: efflux RND transporter periplasmic adaptor subunit [Xanthomonadales bacterium]|nr:efflux RND transporter periplasmic adaptor subunit [Xanthomonadales bacterium]
MHRSGNVAENNMTLRTLTLFICCFFLLSACSEQQQAPAAAPPPPNVLVYETTAKDTPMVIEFVGETFGAKDITIRARVEGFLEGVHFQEGSWVKKGVLLYTLESQPFEEKVATRMSGVAEARTMLAKNKGDLERIAPLAEMNAVSKSDLDASQAAYDASQSSLEAAEANLRAARIQLSYTKVSSPIDGIIGKTQAKVGDFVGKDPSPVILNTVSQVDTILVTFFITETQYLLLAQHLADPDAVQSDEPRDNFQMILIDGSLYEYDGNLDFIDRNVDTTTGAMLAQASFPNPNKLLRPGQFTKLRVKTHVVKDAILIPQRSVMELQGLYSVFVVDTNNTIKTRDIEVGTKIGSAWIVTKGLESGEKVVYEGLQKVKDGVTVEAIVADVELIGSEAE